MKEQYMNDEDFKKAFGGMTKSEFKQLESAR